ncbi:MAG: hypothetical protein E6Q83_07790 [Thiothrix sp.]|nr:MAG: hypothetical protein E6Q83_07790 [Thiothrix sp.]
MGAERVKKKTLGLVLVLASTYPTVTQALSLGDIQFSSGVNEPFKARIELLQATPQELAKLQVHVAPPSIFAQAQLQRPGFIDSLKFARSISKGKHYLIISSSEPISVADFSLLLEVTSPKGNLLKRYSVALKADKAASPQAVAPLNLVQTPAVLAAEENNELNQLPSSQVENTTDPATDLELAVDAQPPINTVAEMPAPNSEFAPPNNLIPAGLAVERSARVKPSTAKVAIPLPKLSFKYKYRVRKNDTIFSIAERLPLANLNLDEKVLALYARNPQAFVNGDLTQLKLGYLLRTPKAVGKKRFADPSPVPTQRIKKAPTLERERPAKTQETQEKRLPTAVSPVGTILASAPAIIDPPLARAVQELQLASQLKLSDLQERLTQAQQLLATRAQENAQLKELIQEKNRLMTRHEEDLAKLQDQVKLAQEQSQMQAQAVLALGAAGPEGKMEGNLESTLESSGVSEANTWKGVLTSPLVWQAGGASALFLLLLGLWQKRRHADKLMQLQVQNSILMPEFDLEVEDKTEASLLDFLWGEEELEQAREQLQNLRHSMASLREQSQRLQAYLNPTPAPLNARPITSLQASFQL